MASRKTLPLSMKDNEPERQLCAALIEAGVRSFKIEGLRDMGCVKNITAHYRQELDAILEDRPDCPRSSSGQHRAGSSSPIRTKPSTAAALTTFHRTPGSTRRLRLADLHRPAGWPCREGQQGDLIAVTHEPLSNGDGLTCWSSAVVGFAPISPS